MSIKTTARSVKEFVIRHRFALTDLTFIAFATLAAAYLVFEVDVFVTDLGEHNGKSIEADEIALLGAALCVGLVIFAWRRLREQKRETTRRRAAEQRAREIAYQDPLTGLPNRRQFSESLDVAVGAPPASGAFHALMLLDLNGFKQINDVYGHGTGDEALIVVAERLLASVRQGDLVARLGGDEFAILAQHLPSAETATGIALRVNENLAPPIVINGTTHYVSTGIGICPFPFDGASAREVMRRADVALYKAKAGRIAPASFFEEAMDRLVQERHAIETALRRAIPAQEVRPLFQPMIDLRSKEIVSFESIPQWTHPELGDIAPERLLAIAEDAGLIADLTDQLLSQACLAARRWPDSVTLSFNIPSVELRSAGLGLRILAILGRTGLAPSRLEIAIAESALVRDLPSAQTAVAGLREAGIRIAVANFGTGYSSLYHLRNFRLDKIKIDRRFIASMASEQESAEIVNALVGLGRGLGFTVAAEGVQSERQEAELLEKGCQEGQGGLFGTAIPADTTAALFEPPQAQQTARH